jgi:hypothetical protein
VQNSHHPLETQYYPEDKDESRALNWGEENSMSYIENRTVD